MPFALIMLFILCIFLLQMLRILGEMRDLMKEHNEKCRVILVKSAQDAEEIGLIDRPIRSKS